jgi:nucleoside phosphorylase
MWEAFPELEHGLLVGIGGGVPVKTDNGDVRLGDVVVGTPAGVHPGTVRYDQGKTETGGFTHTGCLSRPPAPFLVAAKKLEAIRRPENDPIGRNLKRFEVRRPAQEQFHPGENEDRLYEPGYCHQSRGIPCSECGCDPERLVHRDQRNNGKEPPYVVVHGGTIATGGQVIKDPVVRDEVAQKFGAICFEMEAAGVLYDFPCLVIRGISDYCDSHKDRKWHNYAAATAAAYARALLEHVPYQRIKRLASNKVFLALYSNNISGPLLMRTPTKNNAI